MRVGFGYDAHSLIIGRPLVLGGITIPHERGLGGHSDGDVLIHAIIDALLGASGLGDIGYHFPSTDSRYRNISSVHLLEQAVALLLDGRWHITGVDATIVAEKPLLSPFIPQMRQRIADAVYLPLDRVNAKATSTDGLGFTGREEGMAAQAVATIEELANEGV